MFNKFEATDLTDLHDEAKQHIREKVQKVDCIMLPEKKL